MFKMDVRIAAFALCMALTLDTACSNLSTLSRYSAAATGGTSQVAKPAQIGGGTPDSTTSPIPLIRGMSMGVNTFADGDTPSGGQGQKIDNLLECHGFLNSTFHIHVHLSIFDRSGTQIMVPWGIGIVPPYGFNSAGNFIDTGTCFYNLHTHDRSGVIHDEAKTDLGLTLGQFFDIWGMPLSTTDVAGYTGTVWVKIITSASSYPWSDTTDPRTILLTEHEQITLSINQPVIPVPKYSWTY